MRFTPSALVPLLLLSNPVLAGEPSPLQPDARGKAAPDRSFDLQKLTLDVAIDPAERSVEGFGRYEIARLADGPLVLDQVALQIRDVKVDGAAATWRVAGDTLVIEVPSPRGARSTVEVSWTGHPRTGLHFRDAEDGSSDTFDHVWTQGEGEDNRHWFPGWDHPNDRFAYSGTVRAPAGWKTITNPTDDLVNYLIMVAAGDYEIFGAAPYTVWAPRGTPEDQVRPLLDPIPGMMAHFAARSGVSYPWGEYRQVVVQRFLYTAMENTSATINAAAMLRPPALAETSRWVESVVAHELAHHWYGDLLTCRHFREMWLNEGFATFMAADWMASAEGPASWAGAARGWFLSSQDGPALAGRFHQGADRPDFHNPYSKGASVLQMLRVMLGEEVFWEGIRHYTTSHQRGLVETDDLRRSMETVSGQELGWFFQQWVELPYVPSLQVSHSFADGALTVTVAQQTGKDRPIYTLPIEIEVGTPEGPIVKKVWLQDEDVEIQLPLSAPPSYVAFDPRGGVLAAVKQQQDAGAWAMQTRSPSPYARLVAIAALGETKESEALVNVLGDTRAFQGERAAAAAALGEQRVAAPLLPYIGTDDDVVRHAVAEALGKTVGKDASKTLLDLARKDPNTDVRAAALAALDRVDRDAALTEARRAIRVSARSAEPLRESAAQVLGARGAASDLSTLLDPKLPVIRRNDVLWAAVRISERAEGKARDELRARVARAAEALLADADQRQRELAVAVLGEVGDEASTALLEQLRRAETAPGLVEAADAAIDAIARRTSSHGQDVALDDNDVDARIEALERRLDEAEAELKRWEDRH